jgi:hypothetical protein
VVNHSSRYPWEILFPSWILKTARKLWHMMEQCLETQETCALTAVCFIWNFVWKCSLCLCLSLKLHSAWCAAAQFDMFKVAPSVTLWLVSCHLVCLTARNCSTMKLYVQIHQFYYSSSMYWNFCSDPIHICNNFGPHCGVHFWASTCLTHRNEVQFPVKVLVYSFIHTVADIGGVEEVL